MSDVATEIVIEHWLRVLRDAFLAWLIPAAPDGRAQWGLGGGAFTATRILIQPTNAGQRKPYIGQPCGWIGEIAVRAQAKSLEEATQLLTEVAAAIPASADLTDEEYAPGWTIQIRSLRPQPGFTGKDHFSIGAIYRVRLFPKVAP
jgi:hypothetical protein